MTAPVAQPETAPATYPAAGLDRRFYAFAIDRLVVWSIDLLVALLAWRPLIEDGSVLLGVLLVIGTVLLVGGVVSAVQGAYGLTPGKALLGLRVVRHGTGEPIGLVPGLLRGLVLGVGALPTFGLGVATLAWTAVMDRDRQRRGWHDHVAGSIVVDVRPVPAPVAETTPAPRHIVNLTAMRLVPAPQPLPVTPPRAARSSATPVTPAASGTPVPPAASATPASPAPVDPAAGATSGVPAAVAVPPPPRVALTPAPPLPPGVPGPAAARPPGVSTAERTAMRDGSAAGLVRWRVTFDTGETFVVEGLALVGRRPEPRPGEPVRHLVPLRSDDMSLSKTHAQFQVAKDGVLVVTDRGSTNGSVLVRQGVTRELPAGKSTTVLDGDLVQFGDRQMTVGREG